MSASYAERAAHARWMQRRRRLLEAGEWQPFVPAGPVREHIKALQTAGMPVSALTKRLNLTPTAFDHMMCGRNGVLSQQVRRETAEAVMSYWPTLADFPDMSRIDATGTRRRVQALMRLGWPQRAMAQHAGIRERQLSHVLQGERLTARMARVVAGVYDDLWNKTPEHHGVTLHAAHQTRVTALRRGYVGPLAWDDDTIDDPSAAPLVDAPEPSETESGENALARFLMGESVRLGPAERGEALTYLMEWTDLTVEQIAARLESTPTAVDRKWYRIKTKAREEGRPVPWRRVFEQAYRGVEDQELAA